MAVVRSTDCLADSRVNRIIGVLEDLGLSIRILAWDRENNLPGSPSTRDQYFRKSANYGRGLLNAPHQLGFQRFVRSKLADLKPDLVYACDLDGALMVTKYCRQHHRSWIFDQFDLFHDRIQIGIIRRNLELLETHIARSATARIVASPERRIGAFADAFVVGNAPSESVQTQPWRLSRILYYGGVLQEDRGLRTAIAAMAQIPNWTLRIAGHGPMSDWIASQAELVDNLHFLGRQPHEEVLSEMSQATAVLALYDPSISNNVFTASNKLGEAALVNRPLITSQGTGIDRSAMIAGFGFSTMYGSVDGLFQAIRDIEFAFNHSIDIAAACANYQRQHGWPRQREQLLAALSAAGVTSAESPH